MDHDPAQHARRALLQHAQRCRDAIATSERTSIDARVKGLIAHCRADPYLREIVDGLVIEAKAERAQLDREVGELAAEVAAAVESYAKRHPAIASAHSEPFHWPTLLENVRGVAALVAGKGAEAAGVVDAGLRGFPFDDGTGAVRKLLSETNGLASLLTQFGVADQPENTKLVITQLRGAYALGEWLGRRFEEQHAISAGKGWIDILRLEAAMDPRPGSASDGASLWQGLLATSAWDTRYPQEVRRLVDNLVGELDLRLGTRVLHLAALNRYSRAATVFRGRALRQKAASGGRAREAALRDDVAEYLFARGFDVITEVLEGAVRHDLRDLGASILVEAKCCGKRGDPRKQVLRGARQLLDYAARLAGGGLRPDAFLVVFRVGGPRLDLPTEPIQIGNHAFRIVLVDIAPAAESGSRAPGQLEITTQEIREHVTRLDRRRPATKKRGRR